MAAGGRLRHAHFGNWVKVNYLVNLKSGLCPEDCSYCSQRLGSEADVLKYRWLPQDEALRQAKAGIEGGASRICMVASGRGPSAGDVERVAQMVDELKAEHPHIEVCACLGILRDGQAEQLKAAGVDAYNHNLNTSESRYCEICSTHTYEDRVATVELAKRAGLSPCSGLIVGMGESDEEVIDTLFALRTLGSDSIPVNFLMPFDGTPLAGTRLLTPLTLPADPGARPLRLPGPGDPDGRRSRDAPAFAAVAGAAPGQLAVPGRLPDQRGAGRQGGPGDDRRRRVPGAV